MTRSVYNDKDDDDNDTRVTAYYVRIDPSTDQQLMQLTSVSSATIRSKNIIRILAAGNI